MRTLSFTTKKLIAVTLCASLVMSTLSLPALLRAQETTGEETAPSTTETLRERIQNIVEQQKDRVQSVLGEITNQRRGFVGQVVRVSEETLGLEVRGAARIVPIDNSVILMRSGAEIEPENIEIGSWAMVLGLLENDSFIAKKITFFPTSLRPKTHIVYLGTVKNLATTSLDFQPRGQEETFAADVTRTTVFQDSTGEEAALKDFVDDDQVLLVGYKDDENTIVTVMRALAPFTRDE